MLTPIGSGQVQSLRRAARYPTEVAGLVLNEVMTPSPPGDIPVIHALDAVSGSVVAWAER